MLSTMKSFVFGLCCCVAMIVVSALGGGEVFAQDGGATVSVTEAIDFGEAVTSLMTKIGTVIAAIVGAFFTILLVKIGVQKIRQYVK